MESLPPRRPHSVFSSGSTTLSQTEAASRRKKKLSTRNVEALNQLVQRAYSDVIASVAGQCFLPTRRAPCNQVSDALSLMRYFSPGNSQRE